MARFLDGPAAGLEMDLRTCPTMLRLVQSTDPDMPFARRRRGGWDALDQPDDVPNAHELRLLVYRLVAGTNGVVFVRPGGRFEYGDYTHVEGLAHPLLEAFRDRDTFRTWAVLTITGETTHAGRGLPTNVGADLARINVEAFRLGASRLGELGAAVETQPDTWTIS